MKNKIDTKALREKILYLAMRGKLVPQDPNDEPASVLLENIKQEKEQLLKEKVIKKQKPLPSIEKEEEPFEIPSSWEWVRLGDIGVIKSGGTPKTNVEEYWDYGTIPWITPADMGKVTHKKYLSNCNKKITNIGLEKSSAQLIPENSIVYSSRAPIGHINIVPFSYTTNQGCKSYTAIKGNIDYFYYILLGSKSRIEKEGSGTTFKEISLTAFSNVLVPLSPLKEQQRIVSKIEELFAELDNIDKAQETYDSATNKLRDKVLDCAMRGKLVSQDPSDEPASELLRRIEKEKENLIQEKVIKNNCVKKIDNPNNIKNTTIPKGWVFTYFGDITFNFDFKRIPLSAAQRKTMDNNYDYYGATGVIGKVENYIFDEPMLLITEDGSLYGNNPIAFLAEGKYWVNNHAHVTKSINMTIMTYLKYYLNSISISPYVTGTVQLKLNQKNLNSIPILLPPEQEQIRIIQKIESIIGIL